MSLAPGLRSFVQITVADTDTAIAMGSGDVPVLGTPRLLALAEAATVQAIRSNLEPGQTSVGTSAVMEHQRPSPIGAEVFVEGELTKVDDRRLLFSFSARQIASHDHVVVVAVGTLERVLVDRDRFVSRAQHD